jgi:hypothetical protein
MRVSVKTKPLQYSPGRYKFQAFHLDVEDGHVVVAEEHQNGSVPNEQLTLPTHRQMVSVNVMIAR